MSTHCRTIANGDGTYAHVLDVLPFDIASMMRATPTRFTEDAIPAEVVLDEIRGYPAPPPPVLGRHIGGELRVKLSLRSFRRLMHMMFGPSLRRRAKGLRRHIRRTKAAKRRSS